jgi:hypothetical protein
MELADMVFQGITNRKAGNEFEKRIEPSFKAYAQINRARLDFMPLPMTPCGLRHPKMQMPLYIPKGKAPFDVYGFAPKTIVGKPYAIFVGAELKTTAKPEVSLPIVAEGGHASGLAFHQLSALALVAMLGGIARVVWDNGGVIGVLENEAILHHSLVYQHSRSSEAAGKGTGPRGSRSIQWSAFKEINQVANVGGNLIIDWLLV